MTTAVIEQAIAGQEIITLAMFSIAPIIATGFWKIAGPVLKYLRIRHFAIKLQATAIYEHLKCYPLHKQLLATMKQPWRLIEFPVPTA